MIIQHAIDLLKTEAEGILRLADRIDEAFTDAVELIFTSRGRLIVSGIGKPGIVGRKIVATLNSTGTPSLFLHPIEAMHGDLGIVGKDDIFLALSNSGETELNDLVPTIKEIGCKVIALTGNTASTLADLSDLVIDVGVEKEGCPLGLAPMASTTALLAMGDALAAVLIEKREFKSSDFKRFHPGGALGQQLSNKVKDIMLTGESVPRVLDDVSMETAIEEINRFSLGVTLVTNKTDALVGLISDGDLRRCIARKEPIHSLSVTDVMTQNPLSATPETPAYDALYTMEEHEITVLPILDESGRVKGLLHLHDILGKGAFKFNSQ
ncbi:MAG: KpsF/GutQ family sugar-phosphate isomerase [Desulfobacterales bacterium]